MFSSVAKDEVVDVKSAASSSTNYFNALTSLRFFVALSFVLVHADALLKGSSVQFYHIVGLMYFFVLSGFVLQLKYETLSEKASLYRFYIARLARIAPLHVATFVFALIFTQQHIVEQGNTFLSIVANFFLLQGWFPRGSIGDVNSPSWALSCDLFLYLLFPLVIPIAAKYPIKSLIGAYFVTLISSMANFGPQPFSFPPCLVFSFVVGMVSWNYLKDKISRAKLNFWASTLLEVCWIISLVYFNSILSLDTLKNNFLWFIALCTILPAALIYLMVLGNGLFAKVLSTRGALFFGNLSAALYLVHVPVITFFDYTKGSFEIVPEPLKLSGLLVYLLIASYMLMIIVERPFRQLITNTFDAFYSSNSRNADTSHSKESVIGIYFKNLNWQTYLSLGLSAIALTILTVIFVS